MNNKLRSVLNSVGNGMLDVIAYAENKIGYVNLKVISVILVYPSINLAVDIGRNAANIHPFLGAATFLASMAILWYAPIHCSVILLQKAYQRQEWLKKHMSTNQPEIEQIQLT